MKRTLVLIGFAAVFTYCGPKGAFDNGRPSTGSNGTGTKPSTTPPPSSTPNGTGGGGQQQSPGETFFLTTVKPKFQETCSNGTCHAEGKPGSLGAIFNYATAKAAIASDIKNSPFYKKMRGQPSHPGGDMCGSDSESPCTEVQQWAQKEFAGSGGTDTGPGTNTNTNPGTGTNTATNGEGGATGQTFFTSTVEPKINTSCSKGGCHGSGPIALNYTNAKAALKNGSAPSATNNQLINKALNANGANHGGGKVCGNISSSPCKEFQDWFPKEP